MFVSGDAEVLLILDWRHNFVTLRSVANESELKRDSVAVVKQSE